VRNIVRDIRGKLQNIREIMRDPSAIAQNRQQEKEMQIQLEKCSLIEECNASVVQNLVVEIRLCKHCLLLCTHEE